MQEIHLKLSQEEVNLIFKVLSLRPFHEVFELIGIINEQVNQQMPQADADDLLNENDPSKKNRTDE